MIANLRQSNDAFLRYRSNGPFGKSGKSVLSLIAAKEISFGALKISLKQQQQNAIKNYRRFHEQKQLTIIIYMIITQFDRSR